MRTRRQIGGSCKRRGFQHVRGSDNVRYVAYGGREQSVRRSRGSPMTTDPASAPAPRGLYFEVFEPSRSWTSAERLVAQSDVDAFAALTGDHNPVHVDAEHAARSPFRTRIAHGLLIESLVGGLAWQLGIFEGTIVALRDVSMRFEAPVVPGDGIRLELVVLEREPAPGPRRGWIRLATRVRNQRGELVLDGVWVAIVQRVRSRPTSSDGAG